MLHILQNSTAGANNCSAMEADTISKNGRSSKSQTSRNFFFKVAYFTLLVTGLILSGCSKDEDEKINPNNLFAGTWVADRDSDVVVVLTENTWTARYDGEVYNSGTYTYEENVAVWKVNNKGMGTASVGETGNATISSNGKMVVTSFSDVYMNGTYTKQ